MTCIKDSAELTKIFNFVLKNPDISLTSGIFNRDILISIWDSIHDMGNCTFHLSLKQQELMIQTFLQNSFPFDKDTPEFILTSRKCILHAIKIDSNSINYVRNFSDFNQEEVERVSLNPEFSLNTFSSDILKSSFLVALHSIQHNTASADFVSFESFTEEQQNILIHVLIQKNYLLSHKSPSFLVNNRKVVLNSIKNDINTSQYMGDSLKENMGENAEIFRILALSDRFDTDEIGEFSLSQITDKEVMEKFFEKLDVYPSNDSLFRSRFTELFFDAIHKFPKIKDFNVLFDSIAEDSWSRYKQENAFIYKRLAYRVKKDEFLYMYKADCEEVSSFIDSLKDKYLEWDCDFTLKCIDNFIRYELEFSDIVSIPPDFSTYLKYKKAVKLVRRLNSRYISFDGVEVFNYKDMIGYDSTRDFYYIEKEFSEEEIEEFEKYEHNLHLFSMLKKDISEKIQSLDVKDELEKMEEWSSDLADELPFKDEYFKLDLSSLKHFDINHFVDTILECEDWNIANFTLDEVYQSLHQLFVDYGILWFSLIIDMAEEYVDDFDKCGFLSKNLQELANHMDKILSLSKQFKMDVSDIKTVFLLSGMIDYVDLDTLSILGEDVIKKLVTDTSYTTSGRPAIISMAQTLTCLMSTRNLSTVPYISGNYLGYSYSFYDPLDTNLLVSGIDTDACFRVDGNDHDFLHYCALNKNGFVLKITDSSNHLIARSSGFRNGNCVFMNQLRSIYDNNSNYSKDERNEIIEVYKKACEDIISLSQEKEMGKTPIDFVFVNRSYVLENYPSNVSSQLNMMIGRYPMDMKHKDWDDFIQNTPNLKESSSRRGFTTDYGGNLIICMASSFKRNATRYDFHFVDIEPIYKRKRNKIVVTKDIDQDMIMKINKTRAIHNTLEQKNSPFITMDSGNLFAFGDNWYLIYKDNMLIDECALREDEMGKRELEVTKEEIAKYLENPTEVESIRIPLSYQDEDMGEEITSVEKEEKGKNAISKIKSLFQGFNFRRND